MVERLCERCSLPCQPPIQRCSACKNVYYCSRDCQRSHWKIHKSTCQPATLPVTPGAFPPPPPPPRRRQMNDKKAHGAMRELHQIMTSMSVDTAKEHRDRAGDEIQRMQNQSTDDFGRYQEEEKKNECDIDDQQYEFIHKDEGDNGIYEEGANNNVNDATMRKIQSEMVQSEMDTPPSIPVSKDTDKHSPDNPPVIISNNSTSISYENKNDLPCAIKDQNENKSGSYKWTVEKLVGICSYNITLIPCQTSMNDCLQKSCPEKSCMENSASCQEEHCNDQIQIQLATYPTNNGRHASSPSSQRSSYSRPIKSRIKITMTPCNSSPKENHLLQAPSIIQLNLSELIISNEKDALSSLVRDGGFMSFRLQYYSDSIVGDAISDMVAEVGIESLTSVQSLNHIQCRFCNHWLLKRSCLPASFMQRTNEEEEECKTQHTSVTTDEEKITKVLALPSGNWDEVADTLACFEKQPFMDFSSSSTHAIKGVALENKSVLMLHKDDIGEAVSVLAIEGYGEEEESKLQMNSFLSKLISNDDDEASTSIPGRAEVIYRGGRDWKDSVGGATLCCNYCCSILGYASIHEPFSFRLLKHRLSSCLPFEKQNDYQHNNKTTTTTTTTTTDVLNQYTCTSFIAREIVRYAESQAVFTFIVAKTDDGQRRSNHHRKKNDNSSEHGRFLLMKLLSWNTLLAVNNNESEYSKQTDDGSGNLEFKRVTKVLFEETDELSLDMSDGSNKMTAWFADGFDYCCAPSFSTERRSNRSKMSKSINDRSNGQKQPNQLASVKIFLSTQEWTELRDTLYENKQWFSTSLSKATILLKLGKAGQNVDSHAALSMLTFS